MQNWGEREECVFLRAYLNEEGKVLEKFLYTPLPSDKRDKIKDQRAGDKKRFVKIQEYFLETSATNPRIYSNRVRLFFEW
jgi:hypothetical protein